MPSLNEKLKSAEMRSYIRVKNLKIWASYPIRCFRLGTGMYGKFVEACLQHSGGEVILGLPTRFAELITESDVADYKGNLCLLYQRLMGRAYDIRFVEVRENIISIPPPPPLQEEDVGGGEARTAEAENVDEVEEEEEDEAGPSQSKRLRRH
uniref:Chromosomal replication initiator protein DnaA n=1 Tax=Lygus hesperus TaxID=30085 RepID=A0A0A9WAZ7_LYGHE